VERISIDFRLASLDSSTTFKVCGERVNNTVKFTDNDNNIHIIISDGKTIKYQKKGESIMNFIFELNCKTEGIYKIGNTEFLFDIDTIELISNKNRLEIEYMLYQDNELVNESKLRINYISMKEE